MKFLEKFYLKKNSTLRVAKLSESTYRRRLSTLTQVIEESQNCSHIVFNFGIINFNLQKEIS